ncbi:helix-turn-helix domain-containing protein [Vibrio barjaei]|uniref:helix-turn-helix domain-containing protein n=1 Tax=Vibrio barjaei TaxID=1676683 RepID=UPI002284C3E8|nr:helix-turn-helix domain-containing protein [Vibrio barjaei]MCY9873915.1 helix-turn-helix domain-containing protein [Vibrio barjaei]
MYPLESVNKYSNSEFSYKKKENLHLSNPELRFLEFLIEQSKKNEDKSEDDVEFMVKRNALIEHVWGIESSTIDKSSNLNQLKSTLSKKIKEVGGIDFIITYPRVGYGIKKDFICEVITEEEFNALVTGVVGGRNSKEEINGAEALFLQERSIMIKFNSICFLIAILLIFIIIDTIILISLA